jgi:hypothetical protein
MHVARSPDQLERLPGWEMISAGLADVAAGRTTPNACTIWIAWPRLLRHGVVDEATSGSRMLDPEVTLYRLLGKEGGNAYGRYNAILRRLVRFEHALDHAGSARPPAPGQG